MNNDCYLRLGNTHSGLALYLNKLSKYSKPVFVKAFSFQLVFLASPHRHTTCYPLFQCPLLEKLYFNIVLFIPIVSLRELYLKSGLECTSMILFTNYDHLLVYRKSKKFGLGLKGFKYITTAMAKFYILQFVAQYFHNLPPNTDTLSTCRLLDNRASHLGQTGFRFRTCCLAR